MRETSHPFRGLLGVLTLLLLMLWVPQQSQAQLRPASANAPGAAPKPAKPADSTKTKKPQEPITVTPSNVRTTPAVATPQSQTTTPASSGLSSGGFSQQSGLSTIRGTVVDLNGEPLIGALVLVLETKAGTYSDAQGLFSIPRIAVGRYNVRVTYLGYDTMVQAVETQAGKARTIAFRLKESVIEAATVEIVEQAVGQIEKTKVNTGVTRINTRDIKAIPTLGTPDLAQYLQLLPGATFTGDQGGQLYLRGGTPVQNMVLLDGAILYNPFHSIGIFSVFDPDYIREVNVYSGGFAAEFGGRVSSVMDIKSRNGSFTQFGAKVSASSVATTALVEGPIGKTKKKEFAPLSFLASVRYSYLDQVSKGLYRYVNDTLGIPFNFMDIYGKITVGNGANHLNLFGFYQQDNVLYGFPSNVTWQQAGGGLNFQFLPPSTSMIISGNVAYSNYSNGLRVTDERAPRRSSVGGFNMRLNFAFILNSVNQLDFGIQVQGFNTDVLFTNSQGLLSPNEANREQSNTEFAMYLKYKQVIRSKKLDAQGQRITRAVLEPSVRVHYYNNVSAFSFEPRFRAKINFKRVSLQFSGGGYSQNLNTIFSDRDVVALFQAYLGAPEKAQGQKFGSPLQYSWHVVGGIQVEAVRNLELNFEGWWKTFTQLTNFNRTRTFQTDPDFIAETGMSYGIDVTAKYTTQHIYAYVSYSFAMNRRTDLVNKFTYAPVFDRNHTINLVGNYRWGDIKHKVTGRFLEAKWEVSARFTMGSGLPFTLTQGNFEKLGFNSNGSQSNINTQNGQLTTVLADQFNGGRLPYFHRLDLSAKRRFRVGRQGVIEINVNLINTYNRQNIFYYDRVRNARVDQLPIVPTFGASFTW
jgi:hypothetical protein